MVAGNNPMPKITSNIYSSSSLSSSIFILLKINKTTFILNQKRKNFNIILQHYYQFYSSNNSIRIIIEIDMGLTISSSKIIIIVVATSVLCYNIELKQDKNSTKSTLNNTLFFNNNNLTSTKNQSEFIISLKMNLTTKTPNNNNNNNTEIHPNETHSGTASPIISDAEKHCSLDEFIFPENDIYCNWTFDTYLCWPPTLAGETVQKRCPSLIGIDETQFAERKCGFDGKWLQNSENNSSQPNGWTNYSNCMRPEIVKLVEKCNTGGDCNAKLMHSERTRILEIIGLMISLFSLLISLIIFCNFRSLKNSRTKIHKNLFVAMVIQVVVRLILYFDQAIIRPLRDQLTRQTPTLHGIENTPYICEGFYVLLEYTRTAVFMWMLIEGLYLHSGVTWMTGTRSFPYLIYASFGWGIPLLMTLVWAFFTGKYHGDEKCWFNYNLTPYYWILEGPRSAIILLNLFFLLNIIRVLVVKLRQSHSGDLEQVRKAVRAAIVLLPLLGITNLLYLTDPPLDKSVLTFAMWSYVSFFFSSFQGFFIAIIYCFMNGEVRVALMKSVTVYMSLRDRNWSNPRRQSVFSGGQEETINNSDRTETHPRRSINRLNNGIQKSWMSLCFRNSPKVLRESASNNAPESVVFELSEH